MSDAASFVLEDSEMQAFLEGLRKRVLLYENGSKKFFGSLSTVVFQDVSEHFKNEEGPEGAWVDWSAAYEKHMYKIGKGGNKLLQDKGKLRNSFSPRNYRSSDGQVEWYNPAKTKSGFPYAYAHDNDEEPRTKLPQRRFMWISTDALQKLGELTLYKIIHGE